MKLKEIIQNHQDKAEFNRGIAYGDSLREKILPTELEIQTFIEKHGAFEGLFWRGALAGLNRPWEEAFNA